MMLVARRAETASPTCISYAFQNDIFSFDTRAIAAFAMAGFLAVQFLSDVPMSNVCLDCRKRTHFYLYYKQSSTSVDCFVHQQLKLSMLMIAR
jgi:hypothetical protein